MVRKKYTTSKMVKGREYWYFRKDGAYIRLPDDPTSEEFDREYWKLMRGGTVEKSRTSFNNLIESYRSSPKWERLAPRTKADYNRVLEYIKDKVGDANATKMTRSMVIEAQTANRHRARFANYLPHMFSILFEHAIDLDWQRDNPAKGVAKIKTGDGHQPWPDGAIETYRNAADGNDLLIMELAIGTGQRIGDILKMKWSDIEEDGIVVQQNKTGAELWIPFTDHLRSVIKGTQRKGFFIVSDQHGRPLKQRSVQAGY